MTQHEPRTQKWLGRSAIALLALPVLAILATACASDAVTPAAADVADLDAAVFDTSSEPAAGAAPPKAEKHPAVTHLGREVLPKVGIIALGRTQRLSRALGGIEVIRFEVEEVLRSVPWDRVPEDSQPPVLTVFCGEPGMLPRTGTRAVLLVARRPRSPNHDVVQVIDVGGRDGPQRLEALREYLAIEQVPREDDRVLALREYLHRAVRDRRKWTRSNAAREYGSLARERPDDLDGDDAAVLRTAVFGAAEADVRIALQSALNIAERNTRGPRVAFPTEVPEARDLEEFVVRYGETLDPLERRRVVVEAALELGDGSEALLRQALDDPDPRVRDAAIASAGQLRSRSLGSALAPMLAGDEPLPVRRSLVRALGYIREPSAVPTLQALARAPGDLGDDACYALARIRNAAALEALEGLRDGADSARSELLEYLLTDAFVQQEAELGRPID